MKINYLNIMNTYIFSCNTVTLHSHDNSFPTDKTANKMEKPIRKIKQRENAKKYSDLLNNFHLLKTK
jgi:hypothetical protein